jgi:hypothetical protein
MDEELLDTLERFVQEELKLKIMDLHQEPFTLCSFLIKE